MLLDSALAGALSLFTKPTEAGLRHTSSCSNPGLSCPSTVPSNPDTCCLNHPSGHFLLTQFWDASPPLGSATNWTIHGLWPDYCLGGFAQFCDRDREHSNIADILGASSPDLLSFMQQHWLLLNGDNNHLWAHEWNKHGTCISTLEPVCYDSGEEASESVTSYFTHAASLYSTLNTYATLAAAGIAPSHEETYTLDSIQDAITAVHGYTVTVRCHGSKMQELWYHYSVRGALRHAEPFTNSSTSTAAELTKDIFIPTSPDIAKSNCPARGIRYLPKDSSDDHPRPTNTRHPPRHTSTHASHPTNTAPTRPFSGRGHLIVRPISAPPSALPNQQHNQKPLNAPPPHTRSEPHGCLIRAGLWYTSGSCATYLAQTDPPHISSGSSEEHMFTLSSLYAPCAIVSGEEIFTCGKDLGVQSIFEGINRTVSTEDKEVLTREVLAWQEKTTFYADKVPGRFEKVEIFADDDAGRREVKVEIEWVGI